MKCVSVLLAIAILLALTNPKKADYITWAEEKTLESADGAIEKGVVSLFSEPLIKASTTSMNFVIFSVYQTTIDKRTTVTTVGALNNFICLNPKVLNRQKQAFY